MLHVDAVLVAQHDEADAARQRRDGKQLPGLEQDRLLAHDHVADQAAADGVAHAHQQRGFRRQPGEQRLVDAVHPIGAGGRRIDVADDLLEAIGEAMRQAADQHRGEDRPEVARVLHDERNLLQEDRVPQQSAADAGHERHDEGADHVVAAPARRPDACQRQQEHGAEVEPNRELERDADHGAAIIARESDGHLRF